jgi:hypothetical protein
MSKKYSEEDITWSSIEKYYKYGKVAWYMRSYGIPTYVLMDEKGKRIKVEF